jgi:long-subunit acyl-CoA synthetase (AMP-forming)
VVDLSLVHARPTESFVVALLVPTRQELAETGKRLGCSDLTPDRLCQDPKVEEEVLEQVQGGRRGVGAIKGVQVGAG